MAEEMSTDIKVNRGCMPIILRSYAVGPWYSHALGTRGARAVAIFIAAAGFSLSSPIGFRKRF